MEITTDDLNKQQEEGECEEGKPPRYIRRNAAFALSDLPPMDYIVEPVIPSRSVGMFFGDPGTKKTYTMADLAVCVALIKRWLGYQVKGCKVLIIDEESGELRLARRLGAAIRGEGGDENLPIEFVSLANFKLDKKEDLPEIQHLIEETGAGLVIFDALAEIMDGDENSKQDTQPVFNALRKLSELTGATIIVIHHSNKAGGYRGSSAIKGALDFMYKVESEDDSDIITFRSEKARDGKSSSFSAQAHWTDDKFWLTPVEFMPGAKKMTAGMRYALDYLRAHGDSSIDDIKKAVDYVSERQAADGIRALSKPEWALAYRVNPGESGPGTSAVYGLTQAGIDYED
jgi:hypothetical protein